MSTSTSELLMQTDGYSVDDILALMPAPYVVAGSTARRVARAAATMRADGSCISFIAADRRDKQQMADGTRAAVLICDHNVEISNDALERTCFIKTDDPKFAFTRVVSALFWKRTQPWGVHPTAVVHPEADIHPETYIGPFTYVDRARIGAHTVIRGHCHIYDDVVIGERVLIHAGTIIGADGFGYISDPDTGKLENFPHIAGVIIEDDVHVGANTTIDRGALTDTVVKRGAKIDNLVQVGHNVVVEEDVTVTALTLLGGSSRIGKNSWIGMGSIIRDTITIGSKVMIGMGAIVTKDVPDGETWTGTPARRLDEFKALMQTMGRLTQQ